MPGKVLMLDDDFNFRTLIIPFLRDSGYEVIHAMNPSEARVELSTCKFDLLIIDGNLPEMDGTRFIRELRDGGNKNHIVFLSAGWKDADTYKLLTEELDVERVLHKPILPAVLVEHVNALLDTPNRYLPTPAVSAKLAALSSNFATQLPTMVKDIEDDLRKAREIGDWQRVEHGQMKAHSLRGSAGTYGFPQISTAMSVVDEILKQMRRQGFIEGSGDEWAEIDRAMQSAKQWANEFKDWDKSKQSDKQAKQDKNALAAAQADEINSQTPSRSKASLLFITDDGADTDLTGETEVVSSDSAVSVARQNPYQVVLVKRTAKDTAKALNIVEKIRSITSYESVPIVMISDQAISTAEAVYYGVNRIVLGLPNESALQALISQLRSEFSSLRHILSIDDDPSFTRRLSAVLQQDGVHVSSYNDGSRVLEIVEQLNPDLLLLDVDMPGISGYDACRMLRKDARWRNLPIIFVTASSGWEARVAAFECGGDDYLAKPIVNAEVFSKTNLWLDRKKNSGNKASQDALTGFLSHSSFALEVEKHITSADPIKKALGFAICHLSNLNDVNRQFGTAAGDALIHSTAKLLKRHFRNNDIRGRWSGSKLAVCLLGHSDDVLKECMRYLERDTRTTMVPVASNVEVAPKLAIRTFSLSDCNSVYEALQQSNLVGSQ